MGPAGRRAGLPFVRRKGRDHTAQIDTGRLDVGNLEQRRLPVLRCGFDAAHRHRGNAAALIAIDDNRRRAERVRARQREGDVALLEATYRERAQRAGDQGLELVAALVPGIVAREIEALHDERPHAPAAVGRAVDETHVAQLDAIGLQRVAPVEAGQRRAAPYQLADRPGEPRRLPTADAELGAAGRLEVEQRDPALEQPDLDAAHLGRTVPLDLRLDLVRRVAFHDRQGRDGRPDERDDG